MPIISDNYPFVNVTYSPGSLPICMFNAALADSYSYSVSSYLFLLLLLIPFLLLLLCLLVEWHIVVAYQRISPGANGRKTDSCQNADVNAMVPNLPDANSIFTQTASFFISFFLIGHRMLIFALSLAICNHFRRMDVVLNIIAIYNLYFHRSFKQRNVMWALYMSAFHNLPSVRSFSSNFIFFVIFVAICGEWILVALVAVVFCLLVEV